MKVLNEKFSFEQFLEDSFKDGRVYRQLRLSNDELNLLKQKHPNAFINKMEPSSSDDGKVWYEVKLGMIKPHSDEKSTEIEHERLDSLQKFGMK